MAVYFMMKKDKTVGIAAAYKYKFEAYQDPVANQENQAHATNYIKTIQAGPLLPDMLGI